MSNRGRPPVLNKEKQQKLLNILASGCGRAYRRRLPQLRPTHHRQHRKARSRVRRKTRRSRARRRNRARHLCPSKRQRRPLLARCRLVPRTSLPRKICPPNTPRIHSPATRRPPRPLRPNDLRGSPHRPIPKENHRPPAKHDDQRKNLRPRTQTPRAQPAQPIPRYLNSQKRNPRQ